jgi:signal recognition particle subunit SRP54
MTQIPIKFIGVGEKLDQLEVFHPDRMAKRILGMGDVIGLIEKATANIDEDDALKMTERLQKGIFTYNDFLDQIKMIKKMGSIKGLLGMIPGLGSKVKNLDIDEKQFTYIEVAIGSMTKEERKNPDLIATSYSRKMRIAKGSGRPYQEINALTKRFEEMRKQMLAFAGMSEEDMQRASRGGGIPIKPGKVKKGKGKNRGGFRF